MISVRLKRKAFGRYLLSNLQSLNILVLNNYTMFINVTNRNTKKQQGKRGVSKKMYN